MRTGLDCVHCFINQAQNMADRLEMDDEAAEDLMHRALATLSASDFTLSPPEIAEKFYDVIREVSGVADPFATTKSACNQTLLLRMDELRAVIDGSDDPFATALKLCIAANAIDFGAGDRESVENAIATVHTMIAPPLSPEQVNPLRQAVGDATSILYLADNAGELVLDRLFIERLPMEKVTVAVRGRPIINDCTMADAEQVGLAALVPVISNGTGIPGTVIDRCSKEFQEAWNRADLVISKGQGNFETLVGTTDKAFFLLRVKCHVVADAVGCEIGELYLGFARNPSFEA